DAGADQPGFYLLYAFGLLTAFLTAFYAFRLWFLTFSGSYRGHGHPHEAPRVMTFPLLILAGFAVGSGLLAYPMQGFGNLVFFGRPDTGFPLVGIPWWHYGLEAMSMGVAGLGIVLAWSMYAVPQVPPERFAKAPGAAFIHRMLTKRYWIDDVYDAIGRTVIVGVARGLDWFDRNVVDGIVNAVGRGGMRVAVQSDVFDRRVIGGAVNAVSLETIRTSWRLRQRESGQVQSYAWVMVVGIVERFGGWKDYGFNYIVGVDGLSVPLIWLTALLTTLAIVFHWDEEQRPRAFFGLFMFLEMALVGVFQALDFILFAVFWELVLLPMFFLIGIWGGPNRRYAALKFLIFTHVGFVIMLLSMFTLYWTASASVNAGVYGVNAPTLD